MQDIFLFMGGGALQRIIEKHGCAKRLPFAWTKQKELFSFYIV